MPFDDEVPLDREEEQRRTVRAHKAAEPANRMADLLYATRLRELGPRPAVSVAPDMSVREVCERMREHKIGCVLVMDGPSLVGIFTERDVLYKVAGTGIPEATPVERLMTRNPTTLRAGHRLAHALNKMSVDGCRHIPVVDAAGKPVGMVSVRRIVDHIVEHFAPELLNLPPDPDQEMSRPEGG